MFAQGTILSITISSVLTPIAKLTSVTGLDISADEIDVTTHDSADGYRQFEQGLKDAGSVEIEGILDLSASQVALKTLLDSGAVAVMKIDFPDDLGHWDFSGFITALSTDAPIDDKISFSASIKVTGKPTLSSGS